MARLLLHATVPHASCVCPSHHVASPWPPEACASGGGFAVGGFLWKPSSVFGFWSFTLSHDAANAVAAAPAKHHDDHDRRGCTVAHRAVHVLAFLPRCTSSSGAHPTPTAGSPPRTSATCLT